MKLDLAKLFSGNEGEQTVELTYCQVNQLPAISGYSYWLAVKGCNAIQYFGDESIEIMEETGEYYELRSTTRSIISRDERGFKLTRAEFENLVKEQL